MFIITSLISKIIGVPEPSIRLFLTILLGYPIGYVYHQKYQHSTRQERNHYILLTGLGISFFFNSFDIYHSFITVAVSYYLCKHISNRTTSAALVWIFNACYLLLGYHFVASDGYDINWTTAQCVLCLRLMGFSMDYLDGQQQQQEEKKELTGPHSFASDSPLKQIPDFVEFLGYCYFPTAFLIGPQFSFSLYSRFLSSTLQKQQKIEDARKSHVIRCVLVGVVYIVALQTLGAMYPTSYLLTKEYSQKSFMQRQAIYWLSGKLVFTKYLGVWLLTEGACTLFGINYQEQEGNINFSGLANCKPLQFELMTSIEHFVPTFNINTNLWVKHYVFKRLRFLGNKNLSQIGAFLFLAIWHGTHFNYFDTFLLEFAYIFVERIIRALFYTPIVKPKIQQHKLLFYAWKFIAWLTATTSVNYAMVGFDLLTFSRGAIARNNVYWYAHIFVFVVLAAYFTCKPKRKTVQKQE